MKNKHLILLFLATIVVGLLARRVPWFKANIFQTNLIELDTAQVTQISVFRPGQPELLFERTESGWVAAQELRTVRVSPEQISPVLATLTAVRSLRIVKTTQPDTLGFSENNRLRVQVFRDKDLLEQFEIGYETLENGQPASYIYLSRHEGYYLVQNHLRGIFSKNLDDFREKSVCDFDPAAVKKIVLEWRTAGLNMQYLLLKNDSTAQWNPLGQAPPEIANDTIQAWLRLFGSLNGSPFADNFDESRARETLLRRMTLHLDSSDSVVFQVFYVKPPDVPEELSFAKAKGLPLYVVHSSQNPTNFFAPADTLLLRRICFGLMSVENKILSNE
ncbi:MAG TPA: DUF4340 domain-containing protein [Saprospiraceae bacterium]|nr:DUF4340 domain-containing protein [Saprospiraceae bacterium]